MAEYIEREKFKNILEAKAEMAIGTPKEVFYNAAKMLELIPAADVVEVRHGECLICSGRKDIKQDCDNGYYIEVDREQYEMSVWFGDECLAVFSIDFCPNCGAKMDGKDG